MPETKEFFREVEEDVTRCVRCAACLAVCPLYQASLHEARSPRGKVQLASAVLKGELKTSPNLARIFDFCLTCRACEEACPSGVRVVSLVLAGRAALAGRHGLPFPQKAILASLDRGSLLYAGVRAAGKIARFLPGRKGFLPAPADRLRVQKSAGIGFKGKAVFYPGCLINSFFPETGEAAIDLLGAAGLEVILPRRAACCGLPAYVYGELEEARRLARRQLDELHSLEGDYLVTACPSCGEAFRRHYQELLGGEPAYAEKACRLAARSRDISEILAEHCSGENLAKGDSLVVAYHDPCHLARGQGVRKEPRRLLASLPGVRLVEMTGAGACCGGAGSFGLLHPRLAAEVGRPRALAAIATGAQTLVTGCPACRWHLETVLLREGLPLRVAHTVEFVAARIGLASDNKHFLTPLAITELPGQEKVE